MVVYIFLGWSKTKAGHKSRDLHELKWSWRYKANKYLIYWNCWYSNTVESLPTATNSLLSTTAPHYNSYSFHSFINWLLFRPLYNDHFLLSPRWPLITVILYQVTLVTLVTQVISYGFQTSLQCNPLNPYFADEVEIKFNENKAWLVNSEYNTQPLVAHGNGPSKVVTNKIQINDIIFHLLILVKFDRRARENCNDLTGLSMWQGILMLISFI